LLGVPNNFVDEKWGDMRDDRSEGMNQFASGGTGRALLRQTIVLAHVADGAELRMRTGAGTELVVSRHPAADLTPCQVRAALLAAALPGNVDCFALVEQLELGGSLTDLGGGVFFSSRGPAPERWFATCLPPDDVAAMAAANDLGLPADAVTCAVLADPEVAVSAVRIRAGAPGHEDRLDDAARWLHGACVVEELLREALGAPSAVER
jgi:hypothetical protein